MEEKKLKNDARNCYKIFLWIFVAILLIKFIAFITFIVVVETQKKAHRNDMECQAYYLKKLDISEESFNSNGEYFGDHESCTIRIDIKIKFIMTSVRERMNAKTNRRAVTKCIENNLRDSDYINGMLLQEIVQYSKISWKFWAYFRRNERYKNLVCNLNKMENFAYDYCTNNDSRGSHIDEINGSGDFNFNEDDDDDEDYKRHVRSTETIDVQSDLYFVNN